MAITAIIHMPGEEPFLAELDELPNPQHTFVLLRNMRKKNGQSLAYVSEGASAFLYAWNKITFIELMGEVAGIASATKPATPAGTTVLGFFRDEDN